MADKYPSKPKAVEDRQARLKAALKANLARRKAQARARNATGKSKEQDDG